VRFRLPAPAPSPPPMTGLSQVASQPGGWELRTGRPTADLHALAGWALDHGLELEALTVSRPTLEEVYLRLTTPAETRTS